MFTLNCKGTLLVLNKPVIMGVINVNDNSFYAGSRHSSGEQILQTAAQMLEDGATILDIGGQSTNPKSVVISAGEELERIIPAVEQIRSAFPQSVLSIDTYYAEVAEAAVDAGCSIVNDISAGDMDEQMLPTVASLNVPFIAMHTKGTPQTMQQLAVYEDITREVLDYFIKKTDECNKAGIKDIIIDPGFGFAKTREHNFELMKNISVFKMLEKPLLAGISRKSMVYKTLHVTPEEALNGSTVLHTYALQKGVNIIRTHDVKACRETIELLGYLT